jgi:phage gpG-like protein
MDGKWSTVFKGKKIGWKKAQGLRTIQKGKVIALKEKGYTEALNKLRYLHDIGINLSPIFEDTVEVFKLNMQANFDAKRTPDSVPQRWALLSKKYTWRKYHTKGRRIANLIGINGGTLKKAVFGGPGWYQNIQPTKAEFGIQGIKYAAVHQNGSVKKNIPARRYFLAKGNKLPIAVINYMVRRIEEEYTGF